MGSLGVFAIFMSILCMPVFVIVWAITHGSKVKLRHKELEVLQLQASEKKAQNAERIDQLEQRMRVLERIVTDRGAVLADEIEALRTAEKAGILGR